MANNYWYSHLTVVVFSCYKLPLQSLLCRIFAYQSFCFPLVIMKTLQCHNFITVICCCSYKQNYLRGSYNRWYNEQLKTDPVIYLQATRREGFCMAGSLSCAPHSVEGLTLTNVTSIMQNDFSNYIQSMICILVHGYILHICSMLMLQSLIQSITYQNQQCNKTFSCAQLPCELSQKFDFQMEEMPARQ